MESDDRRLPDPTISRRRLFTGFAAGAGAFAGLASAGEHAVALATRNEHLPVGPQAATPAPWSRYHGAVQHTQAWSTVQRGGTFVGRGGEVDIVKLRRLLETHELLDWGAPHPSLRTWEGLKEFFDNVADTDGAWWRDRTEGWTRGLITAHEPTENKVAALSTGNEINGRTFRDRLAWWAATRDLPFPHPGSDYGDGSRLHSRDHIGYYVEYLLAPEVEGVRLANLDAAPADKVKVMAGTMVGARHPLLRDTFLPALLDYQIAGTCAPTLAGLTVKEVVDLVGLHYLLTPDEIWGYPGDDGRPIPYTYLHALDDLRAQWIGNGSISGTWLTEEGGNGMQRADRHASTALRVFARLAHFTTSRAVPPSELRAFAYYVGPPGGWKHYEPRPETSWLLAMGILHDFVGDGRLVNRSRGVRVTVDAPTENYAFETMDHTKRIVIVTPQLARQGPTTLTALSLAPDGGLPPAPVYDARADLFKSDEEGHRQFTVPVVRDPATGRYRISLPEPIALNQDADTQVLMLQIDQSAGVLGA